MSRRVPELDAIRGLAAAGVLALHTAPYLFFWAWSCVDLFFVLSGYLITSILLEHASSPRVLWAFYARRALRIWPVYYAALALTIAIYLVSGWVQTGTWNGLPSGQWLSFVFLQYTEHYTPGLPRLEYIWYFDHSWSLAVEEQFYLLWPLVLLFVRPGSGLLILGSVALLSTALWMRSNGEYFYLLLTRVDGLLFGIVIAHLASDRYRLLTRIPARFIVYAALAGLVLLLPYLIAGYRYHLPPNSSERTIEVAAFCLVYSALIVAAVRWSGHSLFAGLRLGGLVYLGRISFAVYMYHLPIGYLTMVAWNEGLISRWESRILMVVLSLVAAHFSYVFVERRVMALKTRFSYRKGTPEMETATPSLTARATLHGTQK